MFVWPDIPERKSRNDSQMPSCHEKVLLSLERAGKSVVTAAKRMISLAVTSTERVAS